MSNSKHQLSIIKSVHYYHAYYAQFIAHWFVVFKFPMY